MTKDEFAALVELAKANVKAVREQEQQRILAIQAERLREKLAQEREDREMGLLPPEPEPAPVRAPERIKPIWPGASSEPERAPYLRPMK
jgi:hypothetical protein